MIFFQPKVSIVIPVYNGANYMKKAIDSALAQTYPNIEIIVINDGSNDQGATEAIARAYGSQIRYFVKENGGVASALNAGIAHMSGEYFSWLSHDDMYYPGKIERQVTALAELGDPGAVCACNVTVIDAQDQVIKSNKITSRANRSIRCFMATDTATGLNGCSLLIPRALFEQYGSFDTTLKATQDYDLWFRFSYHARFYILDDELVLSRQHDQQGGRTMGNLPTIEADRLHARMLAKIETAEMREFLGEDLDYLLAAYTIYQNAGYHKTAARLYAAAIAFALDLGDTTRAARLFAERLLPGEDGAEAQAGDILQAITAPWAGDDRPTILIYSNVWSRGGVERVISLLLADLHKNYHFILVSHVSKEHLEGFAIPEDVSHIVIRPDLLSEIPYVLLSIAALSRTSLVICNPNIIKDALAVYPVLKDSGIKTIAFNHYFYFLPAETPWLFPVMTQRLADLKNATAAVWLTSFNANVYALHNQNGATMPNPNTFDIGDNGSFNPPGNIILAVGRFYDTVKRLDRILKVFKFVSLAKPDARLVIVGGYNLDLRIPDSSPETVGELIDRLDFPAGAVEFAGEQEVMAPYYEQASVLILTSETEGFPLVVNEAGAHGVPGVIFNLPGLEDIITDGVNGYLVAQDDLKGMAEKIIALLSDNQLLQTMGQNAREMTRRFTRGAVSERWRRLIDMLLATDDPCLVEQQLKKDFMRPPQDPQGFMKTIARAYEKGLQTVFDEAYLKEPQVVVVEKEVQTIINAAPLHEFTEKEYKVLLILSKIRNNHVFHFVYADLMKPMIRALRGR